MAVVSFARGIPAPDCLPVAELADCARVAIERDGTSVLSYGPGGGYGPLTTEEWPPVPVPTRAASDEAWVEPEGRTCPVSHPIKAKLSSKIYHLPGGFNYARTRPDRCYVDAAAAEADGLRPATR